MNLQKKLPEGCHKAEEKSFTKDTSLKGEVSKKEGAEEKFVCLCFFVLSITLNTICRSAHSLRICSCQVKKGVGIGLTHKADITETRKKKKKKKGKKLTMFALRTASEKSLICLEQLRGVFGFSLFRE